jgi:ABC-type spermidine/putrescine transport system permease subunit II
MRASFKRSAGVNQVSGLSTRPWRELVTDWKVWLSLGICLLIATVAWLLGYD